MMSRRGIARLVAAAGICFLANGCESGQVVHALRVITFSVPVPAAELNEIFSDGARLSVAWALGGAGIIAFQPDQTAQLDYGSGRDSGTWRIRGDRVCLQWKELSQGLEQCLIFHHDGKDSFKVFDAEGSFNAQAKLL